MMSGVPKIYVDSREKKPYSFNRYPVKTTERRLKTGDYCIAEDGDEMGENGFDPHYAIERKSGDDFLKSITWSRDRFEDELARADSMAHRMPIVVERPWAYFTDNRYRNDIHPNSIIGTVETHPEIYNAEYFFRRDRTKAEQLTYEFLRWRYNKLSDRAV